MKRKSEIGVLCLVIFLSGCVPLLKQQELEGRLKQTQIERDALQAQLAICESQNRRLTERLRKAPGPIDENELEEIKKKAYENAEKRYRMRTKGIKR